MTLCGGGGGWGWKLGLDAQLKWKRDGRFMPFIAINDHVFSSLNKIE